MKAMPFFLYQGYFSTGGADVNFYPTYSSGAHQFLSR